MDITSLLDTKLQQAVGTAANNPLDLKLNQVLDAKVIDTQIMLNTLALSVAGKTVLVQARQPLTLLPGQPLQLQVVKLLPVPEFKIVPSALPPASNRTASPNLAPPLLKLLGLQAPPTPASTSPNLSLNQLAIGQQLQAAIVNVAGNKLTLQLLPSPAQASSPGASAPVTPPALNPANPAIQGNPSNADHVLVTLDAKQLVFTVQANPGSPPASAKATTVPMPLQTPGTLINLQVLKTGNSPSFAVSLPATDIQQKMVEVFKQLLPIQTSPTPLLNHLNQVLPSLENNATVAETLKHLARDILTSIPVRSQLTEPALLKQTIAQSGLFLESRLAALLSGKEDVSFQNDFKLKLNKLVLLLGMEIEAQVKAKSEANSAEILKETLQKTQSALAKLTVDQLNSLPRDDSVKQGWVMELPFFHRHNADTVQIEIEQDKSGDNDNPQKNWAVSITITPPELATIHCRISCYDGAVNTRFWSDSADTVEKINTHLDYLKQQFEQKGLTTGFMEAHQGKPAQTDTQKLPFPNLLSEKV